jgi:hypothetical protein
MPEVTGEISQQFVPSLPKKETQTHQSSSVPSHQSSGLFDRFKNSFARNESQSQSSSERNTRQEIQAGTVEERASTLFQLLLDKVELQVDIHRRTKRIAESTVFSETDLLQESQLMNQEDPKYKDMQWGEKKAEIALKRLQRKKFNELRSFDHDPLELEKKHNNKHDNGQSLYTELNEQDILSGKLSMAELMSRLTNISAIDTNKPKTESSDPILAESKRQLSQVNEQIQGLMEDPKVIEHYQELRGEKIDLLRQVREAAYGKKHSEILKLCRKD